MSAKARTSIGVNRPQRYALDADHHLASLAQGMADTYLDVITESIYNQPRSLQKLIGPSEIGNPCARAILHALNQDPKPERSVPWKPFIGTAGHNLLEEIFSASAGPGQDYEGRWLTENRVTAGTMLDTPIEGSTDLFDTWLGGVIDHKFVGKSTLKKYRAHGPSPEYRIQAHLYGRGWAAKGHTVNLVMIAFLPREGELTDAFIWTEPYQEQIAIDALTRLEQLEQLRRAVGIDAAIAMYPECDDVWCKWCGSGSGFGHQGLATSTAGLLGIGAAPKALAVSTASLFGS